MTCIVKKINQCYLMKLKIEANLSGWGGSQMMQNLRCCRTFCRRHHHLFNARAAMRHGAETEVNENEWPTSTPPSPQHWLQESFDRRRRHTMRIVGLRRVDWPPAKNNNFFGGDGFLTTKKGGRTRGILSAGPRVLTAADTTRWRTEPGQSAVLHRELFHPPSAPSSSLPVLPCTLLNLYSTVCFHRVYVMRPFISSNKQSDI